MTLVPSHSTEPAGSVRADAAGRAPASSFPASLPVAPACLKAAVPLRGVLKCSGGDQAGAPRPSSSQPCGRTSLRTGLREFRDIPHPRLAEVVLPCWPPRSRPAPHATACSTRVPVRAPMAHTQRCPGREEKLPWADRGSPSPTLGCPPHSGCTPAGGESGPPHPTGGS